MKKPIVCICLLLVVIASSWVFLGCNSGILTDEDAPAGAPLSTILRAEALSQHYVQLVFREPVDGDSAEDALTYKITAPDSTSLRIDSARVLGDGTRVILTTDPQKDVDYRVTRQSHAPQGNGDNDPAGLNSANDPMGSAGFRGSTNPEPFLGSAISLDSTSVLLTFSQKLDRNSAENTSFYRIVAPDDGTPRQDVGDLTIENAALEPNGYSVRLTTSAQIDIEYTVKVTNVARSPTGGNIPFLTDPTRNTASFFGIHPDDSANPRLLGAVSTSDTRVLLSFSEPLTDDSDDPINFSITPLLVVTDAVLTVHNTQILLTTTPQAADVEYTVVVSNVTDNARNLIDPNHNSATFVFAGAPGTAGAGTLPRVVGAASTGNKTVVVTFGKAMGDGAVDLSEASYVIVQENIHPEAGLLIVMGAEFLGPDHTAVRLTTLSQNELTYRLTVTNVRDLAGNQLAPKEFFAGVLVDPASAIFAGTPPTEGELVDTDGDGLYDHVEQYGWIVRVTMKGGLITSRDVTSDPFLKDTDGDGLSDLKEKKEGTDPRNSDTDGDLISDFDERRIFFSNATKQDTDNDGLTDSKEILFFKTSPIHADTDGDGIDDRREVIVLNRNPRIADLPLPKVTVGDMRLQIDERFTFVDEQGQSRTETSSTSTTLTQSQETKFSTSSTLATKLMAEISAKQGVNAGLFKGGTETTSEVAGKASAEVGFTTTVSAESARASQQAYNTSISKGRTFSTTSKVTRQIVGASIDTNITIENAGDIAFTISNIELSVLQQGRDRSRFVPVATLLPSSTLTTGDPAVFNIGPADEPRGPIIFSSRDVFPNLVEDLMRSPRGLIFKVANFDILDEFGRNLAFASQEVNDRTAGLTIDTGDGRVERFLVATTASMDNKGFMGEACDRHTPGRIAEPPAGGNGIADTEALGDDVQEVAVGDPVTAGETIVSPGQNEVMETDPDGDDVSRGQGDPCATDADCPGGFCARQLLGGFDEFGLAFGLPMDYVLQDILRLVKNPEKPNAIVAGEDGAVTTIAEGDDIQVVPPATTGLDDRAVIILAGENEVLDTRPNNGNIGHNCCETRTSGGCDAAEIEACVCAVDSACCTVSWDTDCVVLVTEESCGVCTRDDRTALTIGYSTSLTCDTDTVARIAEPQFGGDGVASTKALGDDVQEVAFVPLNPVAALPGQVIVSTGPNGVIDSVLGGDDVFRGPVDICRSGIIEPDEGGNGYADTPAFGDDVQVIDVGFPAFAGQVLIRPGPNGVIESKPAGDDIIPVADCPQGTCTGREVLTRFKNSKTGDPNRFWIAFTSEEIPVGTDFGRFMLKPQEGITLAFGQDVDRDGLFAREEFIHGSSDRKKDSDGDTLGDFTEIRVGWDVNVVGEEARKVFPDPRLDDSDGDGIRDDIESRCETDPRRRDTDGDGLEDGDELGCGQCCDLTTVVTAAGTIRYENPDAVYATVIAGTGTPFDLVVTVGDFISPTSGPAAGQVRRVVSVRRNMQVLEIESPFRRNPGGHGYEVLTCSSPSRFCNDDTDCEIVGVCCVDPTAANCDNTELCDSDGDCDPESGFGKCVLNRFPTCVDTCDDICPPPDLPPFPPTRLDPRNADTDGDSLPDRLENDLGADNIDPDDAEDFIDSDLDGLVDRLENDGWDVTVTTCNNTCATAYNGVCQQSMVCSGGANRGMACTVDSDCGTPACETICENPSLVGRGCTNDAQCDFGECMEDDMTGVKFCSLAAMFIPCNSDADCVGPCVPFSCNDQSSNLGDPCSVDSDCNAHVCEKICGTGTDCADCGPTLHTFHVQSNLTEGDTDFDGLPDLLERILGTDPTEADTDGDGLLDFDEFAGHGAFLSLTREHPGFFLTDSGTQALGTDPTSQDTDGDRLSDDFELQQGWRVLAFGDAAARRVFSDPVFADTDIDGLDDLGEFLGADDHPPGSPSDTRDATDPTDPDTDGDNRTDGAERIAGTNALLPGTEVVIRHTGINVTGNSLCGGIFQPIYDLWTWESRLLKNGVLQGVLSTVELCRDSGNCPFGFNLCGDMRVRCVFTFDGSIAGSHPVSVSMVDGDVITIRASLKIVDRHWICGVAAAPCTVLYSKSFSFSELAMGDAFREETVPGSNGPCTADFTFTITRP